MKDWNHTQQLGPIFMKLAAFLKIYGQYSASYSKNLEALAAILEEKKSPFKAFLAGISNPSFAGGLEAFLTQPVQRIPRYRLLLEDLIKHTEKDHKDYANLQAALKEVMVVAEGVNEKTREAENISAVAAISARIKGAPEVNVLAKLSRSLPRPTAVSFTRDCCGT